MTPDTLVQSAAGQIKDPIPRGAGRGGWTLATLAAIFFANVVFDRIDAQHREATDMIYAILWTAATVAYMNSRHQQSGFRGFGKGLLLGICGVVLAHLLGAVAAALLQGP
jgi:hypothetical protein